VNDGGATDYYSADASALQDAIDAASPGDVLKTAGTCGGVQSRGGTEQTIYLSETLTLRGGYTYTNWLAGSQPGVYTTTLDGLHNGRVAFITGGADVTLENLAIRGGQVADTDGGGIYVADASLTISNCLVNDNVTDGGSGGGLYLDGSVSTTVEIASSTFRDNYAQGDGGAIFMDWDYVTRKSDVLTITRSLFESNYGRTGGGAIELLPYSQLYVSNTTLFDNAAGSGYAGGAIYTWYSTTATLIDSSVISNTATDGGGIGNGGIFTIVNSTVSDNAAVDDGAGLFNRYGATFIVSQTSVLSNTAGGDGGGLYNWDNGESEDDFGRVTLSDSEFSYNIAQASGGYHGGGGIHNQGALTMTNVTLNHNQGNWGGGVSGWVAWLVLRDGPHAQLQ